MAPVGFIAQAGDCDDLDALSNPEAVERCNGKLDDCDSTVELLEGRPLDESDEDGDGYVECELDVDLSVWEGQEGIVGGNDCDDNRQTSYPGSTIDALMIECMFDGDGDGYGDTDPPEALMWVQIAMMTTQHDFSRPLNCATEPMTTVKIFFFTQMVFPQRV